MIYNLSRMYNTKSHGMEVFKYCNHNPGNFFIYSYALECYSVSYTCVQGSIAFGKTRDAKDYMCHEQEILLT